MLHKIDDIIERLNCLNTQSFQVGLSALVSYSRFSLGSSSCPSSRLRDLLLHWYQPCAIASTIVIPLHSTHILVNKDPCPSVNIAYFILTWVRTAAFPLETLPSHCPCIRGIIETCLPLIISSVSSHKLSFSSIVICQIWELLLEKISGQFPLESSLGGYLNGDLNSFADG